MLDSINTIEISELQLKMRDFIKNYNNFCDLKNKAYETNFIPHLTIRRSLSKIRFDSAIYELPDKITIKATISEIILAIVNNNNADEQQNLKSLTIFKI